MSKLWDLCHHPARAPTSSCSRRHHSRDVLERASRRAATPSGCGRRSSASGAAGPGTRPARRCARSRGGLMALGFGAGETASILSNTVVEWVLADLAVLCCGGVSNGIYPTDAAAQVQYLCEDSRTTRAVRRGRRAAGQGAGGARPAAAAAQDHRVRHGRPARPRRPRRDRAWTRCASWAASTLQAHPDATRCSASPPASPRTWPSWSTPRAPPASPRARCTATAAWSTPCAATTR